MAYSSKPQLNLHIALVIVIIDWNIKFYIITALEYKYIKNVA